MGGRVWANGDFIINVMLQKVITVFDFIFQFLMTCVHIGRLVLPHEIVVAG